MDEEQGFLIPWFAAIAVGGILVISSLTPTRTMGATRSARIRWEERKFRVEESIRRELPALEGRRDPR